MGRAADRTGAVMSFADDHTPSVNVYNEATCSCGQWSHGSGSDWTPIDEIILEFAKHFALEYQAAKPRARRGGTDDSEPTSASHLLTLEVLKADPFWRSAHAIWADQAQVGSKRYSPQRIRTCLAGLVRAGLVEERKPGRIRQYRLINKEHAS